MTRLLGSLLVGLAVALLLYLGLSGGCPGKDPGGSRADSVLADTLGYVRTIREQNATIATLDRALAQQETVSQQWQDSAQRLERRGRTTIRIAQQMDSTGGLVPGLSPHDSIIRLRASRDVWRSAALHYSQRVVPALHAQITSDSIWKLTALAKADTLTDQRDFARARVAAIMGEFARYREASKPKPGVSLGLFRVPAVVSYVALGGGSAYVGCKLGGGC